MKVLVLGTGAREHALVRALAADPTSRRCTPRPATPGSRARPPCTRATSPTPTAAAALAVELGVDLVVVGPEGPLVARRRPTPPRRAASRRFGPSAAAAMLEGSKAFAKDVMAAAGVPDRDGARVRRPLDEVEAAFDPFGAPYVVKDDGLAAGKGVVVTDDRDGGARARARVPRQAGGRVVVEEYLDGPEVSLFCLSDGEHVVPLQPAQDFKRVGDGDLGPNTGGMGAYSPLPWAPAGLVRGRRRPRRAADRRRAAPPRHAVRRRRCTPASR